MVYSQIIRPEYVNRLPNHNIKTYPIKKKVTLESSSTGRVKTTMVERK